VFLFAIHSLGKTLVCPPNWGRHLCVRQIIHTSSAGTRASTKWPWGQVIFLNTHIHTVSWLRVSESVPPRLHTPQRAHVQIFLQNKNVDLQCRACHVTALQAHVHTCNNSSMRRP
jgi:hypothetical protein